MSDVKLKACPFCGGDNLNRIERTIGPFRAVCNVMECWDCSCNVYTSDQGDGAVESKWNTRQPKQDCADEMYEMLDELTSILSQDSAHIREAYKKYIDKLLAKARGEV